jgi:hypothetical protein
MNYYRTNHKQLFSTYMTQRNPLIHLTKQFLQKHIFRIITSRKSFKKNCQTRQYLTRFGKILTSISFEISNNRISNQYH